MYCAFDDTDLFAIGDMPDQASTVALVLTLNVSGALTIRTIAADDDGRYGRGQQEESDVPRT